MRGQFGVAMLAVLAACGDDLAALEEPGRACRTPAGDLPLDGPFIDPLAFGLPDTCVVDGLDQLPGRWFSRAVDLHDPDANFTYEYPLYDDDCATGAEVDHDDSDNQTFHMWRDGTRIYERFRSKFELASGIYESAFASTACVLPDDTLAVVSAWYDSDRGQKLIPMIGTRFGPRDTGAHGLSLVGESEPFFGLNLAVDGTLVFVAGEGGLRIFDVADPAAPRLLSVVPGHYNDVKLVRSGGKLVAYGAPLYGSDGVTIVDATDPSAPIAVGRLVDTAHSLFVVPPATLYLATYGFGVPIYDATNPISPIRTARTTIGRQDLWGIHDVHVAGSRVYAMKTGDGVFAVDLATGLETPAPIGHAPSTYSHAGWEGTVGGRRVFLHGDEGMTPRGGAFLQVLDAEPGSPTPLAEIGAYQSRPEVGIHNMVIAGDRAYIAYYQDGVRVVDLSDPTHPIEVGHYNTWDPETGSSSAFDGAAGIVVVGDLVYVADISKGLLVLRITP